MWIGLVVLAVASCNGSAGDEAAELGRVGSVRQPVVDTDSDGMDDDWEATQFGGLSQAASGDFDSDGMTNLEEYTNGFVPTVNDGFEDADGDRYPNVFEVRYGTNPNNASSIPTPTFTVNVAGGGTHTSISAAVSAANIASGAYQIIGVKPGTYTVSANDLTLEPSKPTFLIIGLDGADKTIIDGGNANIYGWNVLNSAVIASLTFRGWSQALEVNAPGKEVRLVDLIVRDNSNPKYAAGVDVTAVSNFYLVGSTFIDNVGLAAYRQVNIQGGSATIVNTVLWGHTTGTMLANQWGTTLTTNYSLAKGQTLSGTGNLAGNVDPKFRSDLRLLWDSPLRGAGGTVAQSRIDVDGETRPATTPDIGVDQFNDSDNDGLADFWEMQRAGNLTTLTSRTSDEDGDGLSNDGEYANRADPLVADTDGDGLSDGDEVNVDGTNPLSADTDGDDMPDDWEVSNGLSPLVSNAFDDADGDRYPNVFEYARSTNPSSASSVPTPTYTVDGSGGGSHTTIKAAVTDANVANGAYQIIGIAPGIYTGDDNLRAAPGAVGVTIPSSKPKLLIIGLAGAAKTIIDGEGTRRGWYLMRSAVIASLTFQRTTVGVYVDDPTAEVRFVDVLMRDNSGFPSWSAGIHVNSAAKVQIIGSTFKNEFGVNYGEQIYIGSGEATIVNTVVTKTAPGDTLVGKGSGVTLTTNYSFVKGQTLTGTGNLAGNTNPKLRSDLRPRVDSPLRGAGGTVAQSRIDLDGELRPSSAPDIGVDQFNDSDADGLPDSWEVATAGNTTTIAGSADEDSDGLTNAQEYDIETKWNVADTDGDGINDGLELVVGTNPFVRDADEPKTDLNHDGVIDSLTLQLGHPIDALDDDGDGVSNADEVQMCTNTFRADTDGDGVPDSADVFPFDPRASALTSDPTDVTAPVITLTSPWYAVEQ